MVYSIVDRPRPIPGTWGDFWDQATALLDMAKSDFAKPLQLIEEALADGGRADQRDGTIRYRRSDDQDQLGFFYELGQRSLSVVEPLIAEGEWTPALAHHWSVLMFAHGYIMPSAFALRDDLDNERRGEAGGRVAAKATQRRWYAHYLVREFRGHGGKAAAEDRILRLVDALTTGAIPLPEGFEASWFRKLKDEKGIGLSSSLEQMTRPKAHELVALGFADLPPTDLPIP